MLPHALGLLSPLVSPVGCGHADVTFPLTGRREIEVVEFSGWERKEPATTLKMQYGNISMWRCLVCDFLTENVPFPQPVVTDTGEHNSTIQLRDTPNQSPVPKPFE